MRKPQLCRRKWMNCWRRPLTCHSSDIFSGVLPSLNTSDLTVTSFLIKVTGMSSPCLCQKLHFLFSSPSFCHSLRSYFVVCTSCYHTENAKVVFSREETLKVIFCSLKVSASPEQCECVRWAQVSLFQPQVPSAGSCQLFLPWHHHVFTSGAHRMSVDGGDLHLMVHCFEKMTHYCDFSHFSKF